MILTLDIGNTNITNTALCWRTSFSTSAFARKKSRAS